ncbi:DNA polymerase/3'-5' exonuclease PolX [Emticicia sp. BO119]|uniref:DNA polymerase/3'-5' exonuclease PolX n=1 Tax=Emticicia sp. BO119 TaxID=2757768 RepID=UPI0015F07A04|nr:DNA polymerase/3'-5' exonuclease PolX [Emticicia sp. BO119]MBA4849542.1 DNA polymerase/3'-5' exonuclease PolX [Emticicia sp. BO119]
MVTNSYIVETLEITAKLMELHDADEFRVRAYTNAVFYIDKYTGDLATLDFSQLTQIQGVGKMMAGKIVEIVSSGTLKELQELLANTPEGVIDMFKIKGIGVKKIKVLWKEVGIDNINDLQIACENGSLAKVKGFGGKTQESILESIAFLNSQTGKLRMDKAQALAEVIQDELKKYFAKVDISGDVRRKNEIVESLLFLVSNTDAHAGGFFTNLPESFVEDPKASSPFTWRGRYLDNKINLEIKWVATNQFLHKQFVYSADANHLKRKNEKGLTLLKLSKADGLTKEEEIYEKYGIPYIIPEMRGGDFEFDWIQNRKNEDLVTWESLKGIMHNHSTYSDGRHSLEQMASYCQELGFEYLGIADHSQSAQYASGLLITKVQQQHAEIEQLNKKLNMSGGKPFKVLKGIESDILGDGSLDYPDEILASFDYIVASVHSNLNMTEARANERLVRAIENPYTTILGHPTGRLLLSRQGYPIDYQLIIDACAANGVVIEINASPYRLDLDWRWIQYALEKGVMLSINPDAHEMEGYHDMHYGVAVARKGGLTTDMTFNALSLIEMEDYLAKKRGR